MQLAYRLIVNGIQSILFIKEYGYEAARRSTQLVLDIAEPILIGVSLI
jgi:hypothetical protein